MQHQLVSFFKCEHKLVHFVEGGQSWEILSSVIFISFVLILFHLSTGIY